MLATADHLTHLNQPTIYHAEWTDHIPTGISWLNLLTSQPIPEEVDGLEPSSTPTRQHTASNCSSSSAESCYVVLEIQRPRSAEEAAAKMDTNEHPKEAEEEEEEIQEEFEELHFAQSRADPHRVQEDQLVTSIHVEVPKTEYAVEHQQEQPIALENYAEVNAVSIEEAPNDILFRKAKNMTKLSKRMRLQSSKAVYESNLSTSSDDEPSLKITKLKSIHNINEYHSTVIVAVGSEQRVPSSLSSNMEQLDSPHGSTTSLDSIEDKSVEPVECSMRTTTTFSDLSQQRIGISAQWQTAQQKEVNQPERKLTRTFAFDRACMEKYVRTSEQCPSPGKMSERNEDPSVATESESSADTHPSAPFYLNQEENSRLPTSLPPIKSGSSSVSKSASIISLMKKYARSMSSEYRLAQQYDEVRSNEPTLLEVKHLDGRTVFKDDYARESFRKSQTLSGSISSRLNRLGLNKMPSTHDLSDPNKSLNGSCRKRLLNRFRTLIEHHPSELEEPSTSSQSRPWQHKTITELFHERKYRVNRD